MRLMRDLIASCLPSTRTNEYDQSLGIRIPSAVSQFTRYLGSIALPKLGVTWSDSVG